MVASRVNLTDVSAVLGHSAIGMTANDYVNAVETLQIDAAMRMEEVLGDLVRTAFGSSKTPGFECLGATTVPHGASCYEKRSSNRGFNVAPTGIELFRQRNRTCRWVTHSA